MPKLFPFPFKLLLGMELIFLNSMEQGSIHFLCDISHFHIYIGFFGIHLIPLQNLSTLC